VLSNSWGVTFSFWRSAFSIRRLAFSVNYRVRIGILGGGQLGRMLGLAGLEMGLEFCFYDNTEGAVAGQIAPLTLGAYDDWEKLKTFAADCDLITYEFENVPLETAHFLQAQGKSVFPPPLALEVAQDRVTEKTFLQGLGIPVPLFHPVMTKNDLLDGLGRTGYPAVLKTRRLGYDGKGQAVIRTPDQIESTWEELGGQPLILEAFVPFELEVSLIGVCSRNGATAFYPLTENQHRGGILRQSVARPEGMEALQAQAVDYALRLMGRLEYVGVLAVEWFVYEGQLIANEIAPRVHNSGHWTQNGAVCSQFENHLRAVLDWPLGDTQVRGQAAMLNLIGVQPDPQAVLAVEGTHYHWYGKTVRSGRKVGHINLGAGSPEELQGRLEQLRAMLEALR
jgi:5-(carboxyamino)imidazole ribonucleotide synthase